MKVAFDKTLKFGGIGVTPWPRLGPEKWFENYKIATYYDWDIEDERSPRVTALTNFSNVTPSKLNTQKLINEPDFQRILSDDFQGYSMLTYKPLALAVPGVLAGRGIRFLGAGSYNGPLYENKVVFRSTFDNTLPFLPFRIVKLREVGDVRNLLAGRDAVMLQHESLSGGKGSFVIRSDKDLESALAHLRNKSPEDRLVVSDYLEGAAERSLQCCVTRHGIFVGPLQKQIINNEYLLNPRKKGKEKFCGAEISPDDRFSGVYDELRGYCQTIGRQLANAGYKGIFGVDFLLTSTGKAYVLEVNQRVTGVTPLLTMLHREQQDIPFYLLHLLELGGFDYEIEDGYVNPSPAPGAMLILHSKQMSTGTLQRTLSSGLYDTDLSPISKPAYNFDTAQPGQVLLQKYLPVGARVAPSARLLVMFSRRTVLDENDNLELGVVNQVESAYRGIRTG